MDEAAFIARLCAAPVVPVVALNDAAQAAPLARAFAAGGIAALEITLRTGAALAAITAAAEQVRADGADLLVGAGTVTHVAEAAAALRAGAAFLVSPGLSADLVNFAGDHAVPLLSGVATASEVMAARNLGARYLKFFPAEAMGGIASLKALAGPFGDVRFCPTGGVSPDNMADYLALDNVFCVGGSWLAPKAVLAAGDWAAVEALARDSLARYSLARAAR